MKYDIEPIKRKMLVKYPFFGSVTANVKYVENRNIQTAATNGKIVYYNPDFLEKISEEERIFVIAHEICHIAFNHIIRSKNKNHKIWNIATDAIINAFLKKDGLKIVENAVDIEDAINYNAEELYEKLLKEQANNLGENGNSEISNNQNDENQDVGHDTHDMWDETIANKNISDKKSEIEKKQKETEKIGEKESFNKNKQEKKKALEDLKKMLSKQIISYGNKTNENTIKIENIGTSKPIIDWRYVLREAITYDVDWSYKNATIEDGVVSANLEEQPMSETEIVLDTSGSINEKLLKNFLRECKNILEHSKLKVGCFDTKFYGFNEIRNKEDIENMKFQGGGGTDFNIAVGAFSRRVENKIIFTDGYAQMPNIELDVIWIVFGNRLVNPKGGKVIQINEEKLNQLYSCKINKTYKKSR